MRKQTGFSYRQFRVSATDPTANRTLMEAQIKEEYLDKGWETLSAAVARIDANDVYVSVVLVKYEDVAEAKSK